MKNKIEEGCLAIIQHSVAGNDGKCVTVGKFLGKVPGYIGNTYWEIDRYLPSRETDIRGNIIGSQTSNFTPEDQLLRIDNYQPEKETCQVKELIHD